MRGRTWQLICLLAVAPAATGAAPDTSDWQCGSCPFPRGIYATLEAGAGLITDDAYRFGDYRGLDEGGLVAIAGFDLDFWSGAGMHWRGGGRELGLDARSLWFAGGLAGTYDFRLRYDALPRRLFNDTRTPFAGAGTSSLSLPARWIPGGATSAMSALASSLSPVHIGHDRKAIGLGLRFTPSSRFEYEIAYRHEERDGTGIHSGSFITLSTQLPEPIDYATDQFDASVRYVTDRGQIALSWYGSIFNSKPHSLVWDNPFTAPAAGAVRGRTALPPDNSAHQFELSGALRISKIARVAGSVAIGQIEQDDAFLPPTINAVLATSPLAQRSLRGEVDTARGDMRLDLRPSRQLRIRAKLSVNDRDNNTPRNPYEIVQSDVYVSGTRRNVPYSFKRSSVGVEGDYALRDDVTLKAGLRYREVERDFQDVFKTDEESGWFEATYRGHPIVPSATLTVGQDLRKGSGYIQTDDPFAAQNPLLRKYNIANRDREYLEGGVTLVPLERMDIDLTLAWTRDDYFRSALGLTAADTQRFGIDTSVRLGERALLTGFYEREEIESTQSGSRAFATADWFAEVEDEIDTWSIGLRLPKLRENLDLVLDYTSSDGNGETELTLVGGGKDAFPDFKSHLQTLRLYAELRPSQRYILRAGYYHEKLRTRDWALDGVSVDTLPTVLAAGAQSPDYSAGIVTLIFRYAFDGE